MWGTPSASRSTLLDRRASRILTADLEVFEPYLLAFQAARPDLTIDYTVASSAELHRAIRNGAVFDLALSSAMDLQFQLANDGYAQRHQSDRRSPRSYRHAATAYATARLMVAVTTQSAR